MEKTIVDAKNIYAHLQDECSKLIFENRLLYSLTEDRAYIRRIAAVLPRSKELDRTVEFCISHKEEVVVYGAGNDLMTLRELYPDFPVRLICDGDERKQKCGWQGIPVISPDELLQKKNEVYVAVCTTYYRDEVKHFLLSHGFRKDRIIDVGTAIWNGVDFSLYSPQYFDKEIMIPRDNEVFVDGGCFDCGTDREFIKWCFGNYKKIYAFEPDTQNYERCAEWCSLENIKNIELFNRGLWNCETELSFQETGDSCARVGEGTVVIRTISIDIVTKGEPVSFIKLDIEGAELEALRGAERTIRRCHPRLAICIYHKPEDIIEIPAYILSLYEGYRLYLRHYSLGVSETVLYAV